MSEGNALQRRTAHLLSRRTRLQVIPFAGCTACERFLLQNISPGQADSVFVPERVRRPCEDSTSHSNLDHYRLSLSDSVHGWSLLALLRNGRVRMRHPAVLFLAGRTGALRFEFPSGPVYRAEVLRGRRAGAANYIRHAAHFALPCLGRVRTKE